MADLSSADFIKATAGGGQAHAYQLTSEVNRISTVATAGDSVKLPPAKPGRVIKVINSGANSMQVFGQFSDTINDLAANLGVSQIPGSVVEYVAANVTHWYAMALGIGFSGNYSTQSSADNLTAHAGGGQANATLLPADYNRVTVVSSAGDSCKLPASQAGMEICVTNADDNNSMDVFPQSGDSIGEVANAASAVASGATKYFHCPAVGSWYVS